MRPGVRRAVAGLTVWAVFGAVAYRCLAEGRPALAVAAVGIVLAHALAELADFERRDRRRAREAYLAQRRAGAHLVSYLPHRDDRFVEQVERELAQGWEDVADRMDRWAEAGYRGHWTDYGRRSA